MGKKVISGLIIAIGVLLILALFNVNLLVQRLLGNAEQSLGLKISPQRIEVTFWPVGARLVNVTVSDGPALSTENLLRAKAIQVDLQFLPLLIGRLRARKIALDAPVITIVRDESGRYNFARGPRHGRNHGDAGVQPSTVKQDNPPVFLIVPLKVSNGTLRYRDVRTGRELMVRLINLELAGAGPDGPFKIELAAAVLTAKTNLKLKGNFGPIPPVGDYRDVPIDGNLQVDALDMGGVNKAMPQFKKGLPKVLQFDGVYSTQDLRFTGSLNRLSLKGAITGTDASLRFE